MELTVYKRWVVDIFGLFIGIYGTYFINWPISSV